MPAAHMFYPPLTHPPTYRRREEPARLFAGSPEDRQLLLCLLLHCADIGNPLRPVHIARKWANRVLDEFFRQVGTASNTMRGESIIVSLWEKKEHSLGQSMHCDLLRLLRLLPLQGDMERAAGLPISPMCDRSRATLPQSQINFIEFVVAPLYVQVCVEP